MLWVIASAAAVVVAGYVYLVHERLGIEGAGLMLVRAVAFLSLFALLANVAVRRSNRATPVTVAVDASLSMDHPGAEWRAVLDTAVALAGRNGLLLRFGSSVAPFDSTPPGEGRSRVGDALRVAAARGGPAIVVTDGELDDFAALPQELRERIRVVLLPRPARAGLAVTDAGVPEQVLAGDSIPITVEIAVWGGLQDSVGELTVREGARTLVRRNVTLPPAPGRGRRSVVLPPGVLGPGTHALEIAVRAPGDPTTRDDARLRLVEVTDLPAAVLVARPLDWEARFLARELVDVVPGGVQAFGDLGNGRWVDLRSQGRVSAERVEAAVRGAAVVLARGTVSGTGGARRLWRWPAEVNTGLDGDWYVAADLPASVLVPRLGGLAWDSLPPLVGVLPHEMAGWRAVLTARLGRRGAQRVVLAARDSAGRRELLSAANGFWRWAFRGARDREVYRAMLSAGVEWLLEGNRRGTVTAVRAEPVVPRGIPVPFHWMSGAAPEDSIAIELAGPDSTIQRRVVFGADRTGFVALEPGVYRWRVRDPVRADGTVAVETFSPEFVPRIPVEPEERWVAAQRARVGLRELWWGFGIAMLAFVIEWAWRLRRGLP
ncbi:MAG: hypothetical protein OEW56_00625 [Gemmatimonadota bacterium]|nr:hypothetical protein [Gemmatimonadota bacterium]